MNCTSEKFYDVLAVNYDSMTEFNRRFKNESSSFRVIIERFNLKSVLDAGCGTGFHSLILSHMGMRVTAVDVSQKMLHQLREHAKGLCLRVKTLHSSFLGLNNAISKKYDSVFCLGNTLVHILTKKELFDTLKTFYGLLNPGGILILQILNYNRILKLRNRIQSIREGNDKIFVRFYDYEKKSIRFNLLIIEKNKDQITHSLNSVRLHPWLASDIVQILRKAKFKTIKLFGSITMITFDKRLSKDLILFAKK